MPRKNGKETAPVIEVLAQENDDLLLATDRSEERRKRAALLVSKNHLPADLAMRELVEAEPLPEANQEIQALLSASREEDDQPFQFIPPKMRIAPGNTLKFELDSGEFLSEITGVIPISQIVKAWWPAKELSSTPPLCSSHDGKLGYFSDLDDKQQMEDAARYLMPHPAITLLQEKDQEFPEVFECQGCPMNAWGTAPGGGRGKACRERRRLLVVMDGFQSPVIFSLPPTSVRQFDTFASGLKARGRDYYGVRVKIGLMSQKSGGYTYGVTTFMAEGPIGSIEEARAVVSLRQQYADLIRTMPIQPDEFNEMKTEAPF